jgi:vacuolar-type H+-ATPase subunit E/Vma4
VKKDELLQHASFENADAICAKIRQDADDEIKSIMSCVQKDVQHILDTARQEIDRKREVTLAGLEKDLAKARERVVSLTNLEKKRIALEGKSRFVDEILNGVMRKAQDFRRASGYADFLIQAIVGGMEILGQTSVEVYYAAADEALFTDGFARKAESAGQEKLKKTCAIVFRKSDFKDLGVVVNSKDGRVSFDNRFSARLGRIKDQVYMELLKEVS